MKENHPTPSFQNILPFMKRYLEVKEIQAHFFLCYFLYSRIKYGSKGYNEERHGKLSAYKSVMSLYGRYIRVGQRIKYELLFKDFEHLRAEADKLSNDDFKKAFLSVFQELDLRHCSLEY